MAKVTDPPSLRMLQLMGLCLMYAQLAERVLENALETVLDDPTLTTDNILKQSESERKRTLGDLQKELRKRARIEPKFNEKLWRFLKMRNTFVHNVHEVPGWDLSTEEGRKVAGLFMTELLVLALGIVGVFGSVMTLGAKEDLGKEMWPGDAFVALIEKQFGATARQILSGRRRKPFSTRSKTSNK